MGHRSARFCPAVATKSPSKRYSNTFSDSFVAKFVKDPFEATLCTGPKQAPVVEKNFHLAATYLPVVWLPYP
jgi:hypothetical protein